MNKDYEEAVRLLETVPESSPNYSRSRVGLGRALFLLGRREEAVAAFDQGIRLGDDRLSLLLMGKGIALSELGRREEARAAFDQAVAAEPPSWVLLYNRGQFLVRIGEHRAAVRDFLSAYALDGSQEMTLCYAALAASDAGDYSEAVEYCRRVLSNNAANAEAWNILGLTEGRLGHFTEAVRHSDQAIALDPTQPNFYYNRGCAHEGLGDREKAIADYTAVLSLDARHAKSLTNRGNCYAILHRHTEAIEDFTQAIRLGDPCSYLNRGNQYVLLERWQDVIADMTEAIRHFPREMRAYIARSLAYDRLGMIPESQADYEQAMALLQASPTDAER